MLRLVKNDVNGRLICRFFVADPKLHQYSLNGVLPPYDTHFPFFHTMIHLFTVGERTNDHFNYS